MPKIHRLLTGLIGLTALAACQAEPVPDGASLFARNCAACHGADARGGGPLASGLVAVPPDLTRVAARNGGTFPRDRVMSVIDGLSRGAHRGSVMPEFGAGDMGPTIVVENDRGLGTPIPADLLALADYLEGLQRP